MYTQPYINEVFDYSRWQSINEGTFINRSRGPIRSDAKDDHGWYCDKLFGERFGDTV